MNDRTKGLRVLIVISVLLFSPLVKTKASINESEEQKFLGLINEYRAQNGVAPLSMDKKLQNTADWMSKDMVDGCVTNRTACSHTDSLGKTFDNRLAGFGYTSKVSGSRGENLIWGTGLTSAEVAFRGWKASPGHNTNMLRSSYKAIGISARCENNACSWVTEFGGAVSEPFRFSEVSASVSPAPISAPKPAATAPAHVIAPAPSSAPKSSTPAPASVTAPTIAPKSAAPAAPTQAAPKSAPTPPSLNSSPFNITLSPKISDQSSAPAQGPTQTLKKQKVSFAESNLIRKKGETDIYIVKFDGAKKLKKLVLSSAIVSRLPHLKWLDVQEVDQATFDSFATTNLFSSR